MTKQTSQPNHQPVSPEQPPVGAQHLIDAWASHPVSQNGEAPSKESYEDSLDGFLMTKTVRAVIRDQNNQIAIQQAQDQGQDIPVRVEQ